MSESNPVGPRNNSSIPSSMIRLNRNAKQSDQLTPPANQWFYPCQRLDAEVDDTSIFGNLYLVLDCFLFNQIFSTFDDDQIVIGPDQETTQATEPADEVPSLEIPENPYEDAPVEDAKILLQALPFGLHFYLPEELP